MGLGEGTLESGPQGLEFAPRHPPLRDGLPRDAWTDLTGERGGATPRPGQGPLGPDLMRNVFATPLPRDGGRP